MISDVEFVAIRSFDRQLAANADSAQAIINRKNSIIVAMEQRLAAAQRELEIERGKRKLAEFKLMKRGH
ncbi:MAG TPA: hypothetical protein VIL88_17850 [Devosia sp.]|jgi:hypothetical protein|uniref:hypothetical protein n=1 Tax=Devosia sp. TaxID=1871048 RepID=UPI002F92DBCA